jgi:Ca-activated chloride channel homolog
VTLGPISVVTPWLAWLALATPVIVILLHVLDRRRQRVLMERLGELPAVQRMMAARSPWRRTFKAVLLALGLGLVVFATARPQVLGSKTSTRESMDLVIAIDASKSMLVGDVEVAQPPGGWPQDLPDDAPRPVTDPAEWTRGTRLERARQAIGELVERLPDDRISIVLFAGASIHFPLTDDEQLAVQLANLVGPTDLMGGSDIGEALRVGTCILRGELDDPQLGCYGVGRRGHGGDPIGPPSPEERARQKVEEKELEERGRALVILTDGGATSPSVVEQVELAQRLGVATFFVGIGTDEGGVVPKIDNAGNVVGPMQDARGETVRSSLDRGSLRQLAELAGGASHYVELPPSGGFDVSPLIAALERVQRGQLEKTEHGKRRDVYHWFLFPGFLLLVLEALIGLRKRVRHPEEAVS